MTEDQAPGATGISICLMSGRDRVNVHYLMVEVMAPACTAPCLDFRRRTRR